MFSITPVGLLLVNDFVRKGSTMPSHVKILDLIANHNCCSKEDIVERAIWNTENNLKYLLERGFITEQK